MLKTPAAVTVLQSPAGITVYSPEINIPLMLPAFPIIQKWISSGILDDSLRRGLTGVLPSIQLANNLTVFRVWQEHTAGGGEAPSDCGTVSCAQCSRSADARVHGGWEIAGRLWLSGRRGLVPRFNGRTSRKSAAPWFSALFANTFSSVSLKHPQGIWSDVQRLGRICFLVVEKLSEDVEDHFSAQGEVPQPILLLLRDEELQLVVGNDRAVSAVERTPTVRGGRGKVAKLRVWRQIYLKAFIEAWEK